MRGAAIGGGEVSPPVSPQEVVAGILAAYRGGGGGEVRVEGSRRPLTLSHQVGAAL